MGFEEDEEVVITRLIKFTLLFLILQTEFIFIYVCWFWNEISYIIWLRLRANVVRWNQKLDFHVISLLKKTELEFPCCRFRKKDKRNTGNWAATVLRTKMEVQVPPEKRPKLVSFRRKDVRSLSDNDLVSQRFENLPACFWFWIMRFCSLTSYLVCSSDGAEWSWNSKKSTRLEKALTA